jgi:tRNA-splicing ligase RtcB
MLAIQTDLEASNLPDLQKMLVRLVETIPAGVGQGHDHLDAGVDGVAAITAEHPKAEVDVEPLRPTAERQFGTLGSGNHFLEVLADENGGVWVIVHSGSRGVGNKLAQKYIAAAGKEMKRWFIELEDPDLAYLPQGSALFGPYLAAVAWAQKYAWRNRERMMDLALDALMTEAGAFDEVSRVHCHHNYTQMEHHMGTDLWVTRKGAVSARVGELSVLPGSMGTATYIVRGLGNPASFTSAPHGAGRRLSRNRARKELTVESMKGMMAGRVWLEDDANALLDEHPDAYKPVAQVLADASDLVEVVSELQPILNFKGL